MSWQQDEPEVGPAYVQGLHPLSAHDLIAKRFDPPDYILAPWLPTQGLTMIFAPRGIGKTFVSIGIAVAVASGGEFLGWKAAEPRNVLLVDGEMPGHMLQERLARTIDAMAADIVPDALRILASDLEQDGLPDLANIQDQPFFDDAIAAADLIIIDNLSTICRSLRENEADSWAPVQSWLLKLRRAGKSVLLIHHSGKSGGQRGSSRKEDVLNSVIALKRPPDYTANQGARFEVHFEKARGFYGDDAEPFEAWLQDGKWTIGPIIAGDDDDSLRQLKDQGLSIREIAERTGVAKSTVERRLRGGRT